MSVMTIFSNSVVADEINENIESQYELITYDVWGNAKDGFQVNQAFHSGHFISLGPKTSDAAINRRLGLRGVEWIGDDFVLYGTFKRNGCPAAELRLAKSQS